MSIIFHKILEGLENMGIKLKIFSLEEEKVSYCFPLERDEYGGYLQIFLTGLSSKRN